MLYIQYIYIYIYYIYIYYIYIYYICNILYIYANQQPTWCLGRRVCHSPLLRTARRRETSLTSISTEAVLLLWLGLATGAGKYPRLMDGGKQWFTLGNIESYKLWLYNIDDDFRFSRKHRKRWWKTYGGRKMIYFHAFFSHIELVVD